LEFVTSRRRWGREPRLASSSIVEWRRSSSLLTLSFGRLHHGMTATSTAMITPRAAMLTLAIAVTSCAHSYVVT
jgi:hypothetical protein